MKIVMKGKEDLGIRLSRLLHRLVLEKEEELWLFSTPDVTELLKKLLARSKSVTEIHISDKVIYIAKGMKIQVETIDGYE